MLSVCVNTWGLVGGSVFVSRFYSQRDVFFGAASVVNSGFFTALFSLLSRICEHPFVDFSSVVNRFCTHSTDTIINKAILKERLLF